MSLPFKGKVFDILVEDIDQDGRKDLTLIDHGGNLGQTFFQTGSREYMAGPEIREVGFHPGALMRWPARPNTYVLCAEGGNTIVALEPKQKESWLPINKDELKRDGFKVISILADRAPRYANLFNWPGWENSLVLTPFDKEAIFLLKNYDPVKGSATGRKIVLLDKKRPSVRETTRVKAIDIDGDGVDELIYVTHITEEIFVLRYQQDSSLLKPELLFEDTNWGMPSEVYPIDLDADGDNDLIVPDEARPGKIHLLVNDGTGTFTAADNLDFPDTESPEINGVQELAVGQDKDGRTYWLAAGLESLAIYQVPDHWAPGTVIPTRHIKKSREIHSSMRLQDVDGDGWLDGVLGRGNGDQNLWIVYGPLWPHFEAMKANDFVLKN